nr:putative ribonuclease H-like domain-containing protein [Tanacetum cinerariifolium]
AKSSEEEPKVVKKNDDAPIIEEWVSDNEEEDASQPKKLKKTAIHKIDLQVQGMIDSGCSRHMTGNMSYLIDCKEINKGYVAFGGNPKGGKITGKNTIKTDEFVNKPAVENCKAKSSKEEPKVVRKNDDAPIIEE